MRMQHTSCCTLVILRIVCVVITPHQYHLVANYISFRGIQHISSNMTVTSIAMSRLRQSLYNVQ